MQDLELMMHPRKIKNFLNKKKITPLIINVSEKQEAFIFKDWYSIGLIEPPLNVPLANLNNLIRKLVILKNFNQEILFICRSGERSLLAAKSLRRLGFPYVWNLYGGIALAKSDYLFDMFNEAKL